MSNRSLLLRASGIAAIKACPMRFRLSQLEGIVPAADTEATRMGTNWHKMFEVYADTYSEHLARKHREVDAGQQGDDMMPEECREAAMDAVIEHLNETYATPPASKTPDEWALERQILLTCFIGYHWYYQNDQPEFLASEIPFELPLYDPVVNMPLPTSEVVRSGRIDHLIRYKGMVGVLERKSTSRSLDADSDYWMRLRKDSQVSMYALAVRELVNMSGGLPAFRFNRETDTLGNTLYDVWKKPTIKPCTLTQAETKAFVESGEYCGQKFHIDRSASAAVHNSATGEGITVHADGVVCTLEVGKKGYAIRETIAMYGARLLQDITERPSFYFKRKEIARTDAELAEFRKQLFSIFLTQKHMQRSGSFYYNENACNATFKCPYIPLCYGEGADAVCDGKTTPAGYKRIFTDLTHNGVAIPEDG